MEQYDDFFHPEQDDSEQGEKANSTKRHFEVYFYVGQGEKAKELKGRGTIEVTDDEVVLVRNEVRGILWDTPPRFIRVNLGDIANVCENKEKRCLQFSEYENGQYRGNPCNVYLFEVEDSYGVSDQREKELLLELLPKRQSDEIVAEKLFHEKLKIQTPYMLWSCTILAICALVFISMGYFSGSDSMFNPTVPDGLKYGADFGPLVATGDWWRIITNAFVHFGPTHIVFNMFFLISIGYYVERLYGNTLFLVVYIGSAIFGSITSLNMTPMQVSAGASGAIFGLYGAILAYSLRRPGTFPPHLLKNIRNSSLVFIVFNLIYGMQAGIDNWCHAGGLFGGFFLGAILAPPESSEDKPRQCLLLANLGCIIILLFTYVSLTLFTENINAKEAGEVLNGFGELYYDGNSELHVTKNVKTAINYWNRAAERFENPTAIYHLGKMYSLGEMGKADEQKALELFQKAAQLGCPDAQGEYGLILYDKGDKAKGIEWLEKAKSNGSLLARYTLACIVLNGGEVANYDSGLVLKELQSLSRKGYEPAQSKLEKMGIPQNVDEQEDYLYRPMSPSDIDVEKILCPGVFNDEANERRLINGNSDAFDNVQITAPQEAMNVLENINSESKKSEEEQQKAKEMEEIDIDKFIIESSNESYNF